MASEKIEKYGLEHIEDTANKALFDALKFSFWILKAIMALVVAAYLISGTFSVQSDEVALVTRFGRVLGTGPQRELKQGLHWSWPWPIDNYIKVSKGKVKTTNCDFKYNVTEMETVQGRSANVGESLVPGKDDFIITGDANILHIGLIINYGIIDAFDYVRTIPKADQWNPNTHENENPESDLIMVLADTAVIQAAGQFKVDDLLGQQKTKFASLVKQYLQQSLRAMNCGLELKDVLIKKIEPPRQVVQQFNDVRNAAEQMHGDIQTAMGDATQKLTQTAGMGYQELIQAIQNEQKMQQGNDPKLVEAQKEVSKLLDQAGGSVQEILANAKIYKTRVFESAKADAQYMQALLPRYLENPQVVRTRLLMGMLETTLDNVRKLYTPTDVSEIRIIIDRDPEELKVADNNTGQ
ncbi:MAG: protease modulator HflK [Phycisphaerae bacterium]